MIMIKKMSFSRTSSAASCLPTRSRRGMAPCASTFLLRLFACLISAGCSFSSTRTPFASAQIAPETAAQVQTLVQSVAWKKIFLRSFSLMGLNHGCMTVCNDQITRACTNLLAESLEWEDIDAPSLDVEETMELANALKAEARTHREIHLMGKSVQIDESNFLLSKDRRRPCKKLLDHACPVACIRRDSGNLPNQKGYIPEYEPGAFEPQFTERYKIRYRGTTFDEADFHKEFSVFDFIFGGIMDLFGFFWRKIA
ncbi:unnamed protein product [Amoebophrya sp. A25]|nr:unnamed protein product [Amoebophrya sp. A25]|eukprot:GSA25T00008307001.1